MKTQSYFLPSLFAAAISSIGLIVNGFQPREFTTQRIPNIIAYDVKHIPWCHTSSRNCRRTYLMKRGKQDGPARRPRNEFSRTVPPDKVLKGSFQRANNSAASNRMPQRQYTVDIKASFEECESLASRFQLPSIDTLDASLSLSPEGTSALDNSRGVVVEGTVHATVTRTCVRTNEDFQVDMDFSIYSVVRPVRGFGPMLSDSEKGVSNVQLNREIRPHRKKRKEPATTGSGYDEDDIDPTELLKMESMLQSMEQKGEVYDDVIMEDESIYATNGMLDVGELVAQLFWLELDPYPRKPGSEFLQFSITG